MESESCTVYTLEKSRVSSFGFSALFVFFPIRSSTRNSSNTSSRTCALRRVRRNSPHAPRGLGPSQGDRLVNLCAFGVDRQPPHSEEQRVADHAEQRRHERNHDLRGTRGAQGIGFSGNRP